MKSLNTVRHVETIRRFIKTGTSDCYCRDKKASLDLGAMRSGAIHLLVFSFPFCRARTTTRRLEVYASCPGGRGVCVLREVRTGARIHHHYHPHHHHHHHHLTFATNMLSDQRLFTPIQSQEAPYWWFIVQRVMNSAVYIIQRASLHTHTHTDRQCIIMARWKNFISTMSTFQELPEKNNRYRDQRGFWRSSGGKALPSNEWSLLLKHKSFSR